MGIEIIDGDLTALDVDVVVNAANEGLQHGGGVAAALSDAGGPAVQRESDAWVAEHGQVGVGRAAVTTAGAMAADHIVHVVGPRWSGTGADRDQLAAAVAAALDTSVALDAGSVALPAISAGVFGGPLDECTRIIAVTASAWATAKGDAAPRIVLVGFDADTAAAFRAGLDDFDPLAGWPSSAPERQDRPAMPDGYGVPEAADGLQDWATAETKLAAATTVWLATTRPDGRPHVVPRWGVWADNRFWYDGAPTTRHVRNLTRNGATTLHLESGTDVVIVDGDGRPADPPGQWWRVQLAAAFHRKYAGEGYLPGIDSWADDIAGGLCVFTPSRALAWASFPTDVTRWRW